VRTMLRDFALFIALVVIVIGCACLSPDFLTARNLSNLSVEWSITAVLALGAFLVILPGQIDLAAGSGVGLFGGIAAVLVFEHGWPAPAALGCALLLALAIWALMGALIVLERIPAFIITLAGLLIFKGLHWLVIANATIPVTHGAGNCFSALSTWYLPAWAAWSLVALVSIGTGLSSLLERRRLARAGEPLTDPDIALGRWLITSQLLALVVLIASRYQGIPLPLLLLGAVATAMQVVCQHTRFGRHLLAIGGNADAALIAGIPVNRTVIAAFAIAGGIVAVTGFLETSYAGSSTSTVGASMELDAIAACVIGGVSLRGGRGTVSGVLCGALIMATLLNGMTLRAVQPETKLIVRGVVLALAVWLDVRFGKR
jgi:D-xylose transport system permease protein